MLENQKHISGLDLTDEEIVRQMEKGINESLLVEEDWRQYEVVENYAMYDGDQWTTADAKRQAANGMECIVINRAKPVLDAIVGFQIQNRLQTKYVPRLNNEKQNGFTDVVGNMVKYIDQQTDSPMQETLAFKDMLICGIGCTDTVFNYNTPPYNGAWSKKRIFPAFVFWDCSAREKNIVDANYITVLKIVDRETIKAEYGDDCFGDDYSIALDARILEFFDSVLAIKQLGVIYEHQWRKKVPFHRVENPFLKLSRDPQLVLDLAAQKGINTWEGTQTFAEMVVDQAEYYGKKFNFDPTRDQLFSIAEQGDYAKFKEAMEFYGIKVKSTKQERYKYFRAIITGNKLISKAENFSQNGFSVKFMTGEFSELTQSYYGLMRGCKPPQRLFNQVVSDYQGFLNSIPKGGVNIEYDAVEDVQTFLDTYSRARFVTVFRPGALSNGKVLPKVAPPIPQGVLEMIQFADGQIMAVCGVTPELMGVMQSKEMNAGFYKQQIRQILTTLSTYFDAHRSYRMLQARCDIDCIRILVENSEGTLVSDVIGEYNGKDVYLLENNIAEEYDIIIDEVPLSPDEKKDEFFKMIDLQMAMPNKDFTPLILECVPFSQEVTNKLKELMKPAPPPEPDPISTNLLISETEMKKASAYKMTIEAMEKEQNMRLAQPKAIAEINLTEARAANEIAKIHQMTADQIDKRINSIFNQKL
jgi:hypothetical protein